MTHLRTLGLVFAFALASTAAGRAQDKPATPPPAAKAPTVVTPLKVQVVISRYQGEKKISSLPYTLSVNGDSNAPRAAANLRMGASVPLMMVAAPVGDGQKMPMPPAGPIQYKDVGTNIDCRVSSLDDGRFRLEITIDDSSVYPEDRAASADARLATSGSPSFRSFRATDSMVLKDGGTSQFTTATDKVNGEVVKVDVTLTVVK